MCDFYAVAALSRKSALSKPRLLEVLNYVHFMINLHPYDNTEI